MIPEEQAGGRVRAGGNMIPQLGRSPITGCRTARTKREPVTQRRRRRLFTTRTVHPRRSKP